MAKNRATKRAGDSGHSKSRTGKPRASGRKKPTGKRKKQAPLAIYRQRNKKRAVGALSTAEGTRTSPGRPKKASPSKKAAESESSSRSVTTAWAGTRFERDHQVTATLTRAEMQKLLGNHAEQVRAEFRALVNALPELVHGVLQRFFPQSLPSDAASLSGVLCETHPLAKDGTDTNTKQGRGEAEELDKPVVTTLVASVTPDENHDDIISPQTDFQRLHDHGKASRQLPMKLLLKMHQSGAIGDSGPNGECDAEKGFLWKNAPQRNPITLRKHRALLEKLGFIQIPQWVTVSEDAKNGEARRRGNAAGPGYVTPKGVAVCNFIIEKRLLGSLTVENRKNR